MCLSQYFTVLECRKVGKIKWRSNFTQCNAFENVFSGSPLKENIDKAILDIYADGTIKILRKKWIPGDDVAKCEVKAQRYIVLRPKTIILLHAV